MSDNPLASSFMMLTDHLYSIFIQYIIDGRTRAPPENELVEMIPTFQIGAKTDRRALQSKFKSWAKRMSYENGYLKLINSGKIIIPKDICDALIMQLHSTKHINLENVITQIRRKYSWTKKNFGMDREVVAESIARNCKSKDCSRRIRMELARINRSFCKSVTNSLPNQLTTEDCFKVSSPLKCVAPSPYQWPFSFPVAPLLSTSGIQFQMPFSKGMNDKEQEVPEYCKTLGSSMRCEESQISNFQPSNHKNITQGSDISFFKATPSPSNSKENTRFLKFRRPTNCTDYKFLMKEVKHNPNLFPKILGSKKTQFLSNLGIAPKSICSSRTLKRFRKELENRQFLSRDCIIYRERKVLRDRNKLKSSFHEKRAYLEMQKDIGTIFTRRNKLINQGYSRKDSQYLKFSSMQNIARNTEDSNSIKEICLAQRKEAIELIDITSSDDENKNISLCLKNVKKGMKDNLKDESPHNESSLQSSKVTDEQSPNMPDSTNQLSAKHCQTRESSELKNDRPMVPSIFYPMPSFNSYLSEMLPGTNLIPKPFLLPQNQADNNIDLQGSTATPIQAPLIMASYAGHGIRHFKNYASPPINPSSGPRSPTCTIEQPRPCFVVPNRNLAPRIVYPIQVNKSDLNSNLLFMNKRQTGAFFVVPQFSGGSTERDFQTDKLTTMASSVPSSSFTVTQLQQIKAKSMARAKLHQMPKKRLIKNDKRKVDINEAMMRISNWIYRMKAALNPNMFQCGVEKSAQKLISQLDVGIYLVREARKSLLEIEESKGFQKFSAEILI